MIAEYGLVFLICSLLLSAAQFLYPLKVGFSKRKVDTLAFNIRNSELIFFSTLVSFSCLIYCFITSDFSLKITSQNSNSQLPLIYKITGVWGNHEGSILLWLLVMTFFGYLFSRHKLNNRDLKKNTLIIQGSLCFLICAFIIFTSNPFERNFPPSIEGKDLNPLLQDPGLAIHPPVLYIGYVGCSVVYSLALAALINKNFSNDFFKIIKPWVFLSWSFLTLGIGLGSWWAYYELGWGGFWFWDPVENASLLPWLTATALLHSIIVSEKKKKLFNWSISLAVITFCLSLLGTFLVRSGVITSVHAFANDPSRGIFILCLLVLITGAGVILLYKNFNKFNTKENIYILSREGAISVNNIFMVTIAGTVLLGTIYPLLTDAFLQKKISVGAPFFNATITPLIAPMILGMMFGPFLHWGKNDVVTIYTRIRLVLLVSFILLLIIWYLTYKGPVIAIIFISLASWLAFSSLFEIYQLFLTNYRNRGKVLMNLPIKKLSQAIAHFGIAILVVGATGTSILKEENIQFQKFGDSITVSDFKIKFLGVEKVIGPNYKSDLGKFEITKNNRFIKVLNPEKRIYNFGKQVTTEAAIHSTFWGDIYISIGDNNSGFWTTRIWFNPFTVWIWLGVLLMFFGGLLSLFAYFKKSK